MIIKPEVAVEKEWVKSYVNRGLTINNTGIELSLDKLWKMRNSNILHISNEGIQSRGSKWIDPIRSRRNPELEYWNLRNNSYFECESEVRVELPSDVAIMIFALPELIDNGVIIPPTLLEGGWEGNVRFTLGVNHGAIDVATGTRIATMVFVSAQGAQFQ